MISICPGDTNTRSISITGTTTVLLDWDSSSITSSITNSNLY